MLTLYLVLVSINVERLLEIFSAVMESKIKLKSTYFNELIIKNVHNFNTDFIAILLITKLKIVGIVDTEGI
jgi:hypothetical protein